MLVVSAPFIAVALIFICIKISELCKITTGWREGGGHRKCRSFKKGGEWDKCSADDWDGGIGDTPHGPKWDSVMSCQALIQSSSNQQHTHPDRQGLTNTFCCRRFSQLASLLPSFLSRPRLRLCLCSSLSDMTVPAGSWQTHSQRI